MAQSRKPKRGKPQPTSLRARALRLLAAREHSRLELQRKLSAHTDDPGEIENLLDEFARCGWLSERRVAEQVGHSRRGRFGSRRIRQDLLDRGLAEDIVDETISRLEETDFAAAREVWRKKFGVAPRNAAERARQVRFMLGRGFALDTVMKAIKAAGTDDAGE